MSVNIREVSKQTGRPGKIGGGGRRVSLHKVLIEEPGDYGRMGQGGGEILNR